MPQGKTIAVLTGGGDCPGLNAVIRAVVKRSISKGFHVQGLLNGWAGLLEGKSIPLDLRSVSGILPQGGTILGTSRTNVLKDEATIQLALSQFRAMNLDALVAIGGEGTLTVSSKLVSLGLPIVGVPKTIDNDISQTDYTFGFDTAVHVATEAIDRLHSTAESHKRVMVVEVMGRHAGWIATHSGIAGGADAILIPEFPMSVEEIVAVIEKRKKEGKLFSIIVVAEGAPIIYQKQTSAITKKGIDDFGRPQLGGIGQRLADLIQESTGIESRVTVLGYVQRGGTPTAFDRVLATRLGAFAVDLVDERRFGHMAALKGDQIEAVPLHRATETLKGVSPAVWDLARSLF